MMCDMVTWWDRIKGGTIEEAFQEPCSVGQQTFIVAHFNVQDHEQETLKNPEGTFVKLSLVIVTPHIE